MSGPRAAAWFGLIAVAALAIAAAGELGAIAAAGRGLPLWDPADHGYAGVRLADALGRGDLPAFLVGLNRQVLWPFMHSLLLGPWLLVFGHDYGATDRLSAALYAATVIAAYATGLRLHPVCGPWNGVMAAALVLLAPLYRTYGSVTMLEMPGAFLLSLTACLHVWACREPAPRPLLIAAGLTTTALFLCKYNYGLLWLAALALHEAASAPPERRAAWIGRLRAWAGSRRWLRPLPLLILAWLLALVAIQLTGGGEFALLGRRVSVRSAGNPAYAFYVVALIWASVRVRRAGGVRAVLGRRSTRHAILAVTVALPLLIWFLIPYPNRVRAFVGFAVNRDSGLPPLALDTLLFYPRAFAHEYSPAPIVGWIVLALAMFPPRPRDRSEESGRDPALLIYLAFWVGLLVTMVHPYRQPRFLFTTALVVWLSAARSALSLLARLLDAPLPAAVRHGAWTAALAAPLVWSVLRAPDPGETLAARRAFNTASAFGPVLDRVLEQVARAEQRPYLLGYANLLSPGLVRWQGHLVRPGLGEDRMPDPPPGLPVTPTDAEVANRIERLRRTGRPVIAALPITAFAGETDEYRSETRADRMTAARLENDPGVWREFDEVIPASGFRVTTFRFTDPQRAPPGNP